VANQLDLNRVQVVAAALGEFFLSQPFTKKQKDGLQSVPVPKELEGVFSRYEGLQSYATGLGSSEMSVSISNDLAGELAERFLGNGSDVGKLRLISDNLTGQDLLYGMRFLLFGWNNELREAGLFVNDRVGEQLAKYFADRGIIQVKMPEGQAIGARVEGR
jgi:hypothetical protein